jgi:hypothetical protein
VVPVCGDRCLGNGKLSCRCMGARDQEAWECRSRLARTLILRRCVVQFQNGLSAWLRMAMLCLMCLLGFWGNYTTLHRPAVDQHASKRAEQRRKRLLQQTQASLLQMRTNAASGRQALESSAATSAAEPPDPHESSGIGSWGDVSEGRPLLGACILPSAAAAAPAGAAASDGACSASPQAEHAYACFSQAVQQLKVHGRMCCPAGIFTAVHVYLLLCMSRASFHLH